MFFLFSVGLGAERSFSFGVADGCVGERGSGIGVRRDYLITQ